MIFTSACNDHHSTEFWAFDKFGNNVWNYSKNFGNGKGSRGLVAVDPKGNFTWLLKKMQAIYDTTLLIEPVLSLLMMHYLCHH